MIKEKHVWFIAKTYIDCKGNASVSVLCYQNNSYGSYYSTNLLDEHIVYFDTEEDAKKVAYMWANTDLTVHSTYIKVVENEALENEA